MMSSRCILGSLLAWAAAAQPRDMFGKMTETIPEQINDVIFPKLEEAEERFDEALGHNPRLKKMCSGMRKARDDGEARFADKKWFKDALEECDANGHLATDLRQRVTPWEQQKYRKTCESLKKSEKDGDMEWRDQAPDAVKLWVKGVESSCKVDMRKEKVRESFWGQRLRQAESTMHHEGAAMACKGLEETRKHHKENMRQRAWYGHMKELCEGEHAKRQDDDNDVDDVVEDDRRDFEVEQPKNKLAETEKKVFHKACKGLEKGERNESLMSQDWYKNLVKHCEEDDAPLIV